MEWHARHFRNVSEVEYCLGYTFTPSQTELVFTYLAMGVRPEPGNCYGCTPAYIRKITGEIDRYEDRVDSGEIKWPWATGEV